MLHLKVQVVLLHAFSLTSSPTFEGCAYEENTNFLYLLDYGCEINLDECESTLEFTRSLIENTSPMDEGGDATLTFARYDDGFDKRLVSTNQGVNIILMQEYVKIHRIV